MKKIIIFIIVLCCHVSYTFAQQLDHVQGDVLIRMNPQQDVYELAEKLSTYKGQATQMEVKKLISDHMGIWLLHFDFAAIHEGKMLNHINRQVEVEVAQFNHLIELRSTIPNDSQFDQQWQYINTGQGGGTVGADIDMDLAWDITTGGLTANGDTIVVCVVDNGLGPNHQDFEDNIWVNHAEIPDNDIDDDGNGFVDDYFGWNTGSDNDNLDFINGHGTPVAGIIGAKGNNNRGVAGVNWNIKLMIVVGGTGQEAEVLEAYSYPLSHRIKYNETNGEEGSFVVATNSSWGINNGQPANAPLWCAFYDTLGVHGILNGGATANANFDIDVTGDLPTACPSEYMIAVTNMNRNDQKVTQAGYGATTIDIGAFGAGTWTVATPNNYGGFGGTSGATPHVVGAIGLLYSAPCPDLANLALSHPDSAARLVRDYILTGVDPNASLDGITTTGGRLNIFNSLTLLMAECGGCIPAFQVATTEILDTSAVVTWVQGDSTTALIRYRMEDETWDTIHNAAPPQLITGLLGCSDYELQVQTTCMDSISNWSNSHFFKSDGCCVSPSGLMVESNGMGGYLLNWNNVLAADSYNIRYMKQEGDVWTNIPSDGFPILISDLEDCTSYVFQVESVCEVDSTSGFTSNLFYTTDCVCVVPPNTDTASVTQTSALLQWNSVENATHYTLRYREIGIPMWTSIDTAATEILIEDLNDCAQYRFQVRSRCNVTSSSYSDAFNFSTMCDVSTADDLETSMNIQLFPNPFQEELSLAIYLQQYEDVNIEWWNVQGQLVREDHIGQLTGGENKFTLTNLSHLADGVYYLKIKTSQGAVLRKVVK